MFIAIKLVIGDRTAKNTKLKRIGTNIIWISETLYERYLQ